SVPYVHPNLHILFNQLSYSLSIPVPRVNTPTRNHGFGIITHISSISRNTVYDPDISSIMISYTSQANLTTCYELTQAGQLLRQIQMQEHILIRFSVC